jgi:hypothetical protein
MFEPIIDDESKEKIETEEFQPSIVDEFIKDPASFNKKFKFPLRHYSQITTRLDVDIVKNLLRRLGINPNNKEITVFGGYTGQFANILKACGFNVIFTDPIQEYVDRAKKNGFESYRYSVGRLTKEIIERSDSFATFECYMPFINENIYDTLRMLSSPNGILFAESEETRKELFNEGGRLQLKYHFKPFFDAYSIERKYVEKDSLRLYHFFKKEKDNIVFDCKIINLLHKLSGKEIIIDNNLTKKISIENNMNVESIRMAIKRILIVYLGLIPQSLKIYFPRDKFVLFSKRFTVKI